MSGEMNSTTGYRSVSREGDEDGKVENDGDGIAMKIIEREREKVSRNRSNSDDHLRFDQHSSTSLLELADEDDHIDAPTENTEEDETPSVSQSTTPPRSVLWDPKVLFSTGSYGVLAMAFILLDETIPLLLKQSVTEGGMSFTSSQIGTLLALSGGALLTFSTFFLCTHVQRK